MADDDPQEPPIDEIVANRAVTVQGQRKMWARTILIKQLLIQEGLISLEVWEAKEKALLADIEAAIRKSVMRELGLLTEPEGGSE